MAESPSHRFGQVVGGLLEHLVKPELSRFCAKRGLYLDQQGTRAPARAGKKVTWVDKYGNAHDFDFVIERDGSAHVVGRPVAFIEAAWRRYTKHSRNKAQEIQGAVVPVAEKHHWDAPFKGAIVAGEFTEASLVQLRSLGFEVLHISYEAIVQSFADVGIDARFDESTPDRSFRACVDAIERLSAADMKKLLAGLTNRVRPALDKFLVRLGSAVDRQIDFIAVIPLYGAEHKFLTVADARDFVVGGAAAPSGDFRKFEIVVRFTSGDSIDATFSDPDAVLGFLDYVGR